MKIEHDGGGKLIYHMHQELEKLFIKHYKLLISTLACADSIKQVISDYCPRLELIAKPAIITSINMTSRLALTKKKDPRRIVIHQFDCQFRSFAVSQFIYLCSLDLD